MPATPLGVYRARAVLRDDVRFLRVLPDRCREGDAVRRYLDAVETEAGLVSWNNRKAETAFWGGGTPGLLKAAEIEQLGRAMVLYAGQPAGGPGRALAPATVTEDRLAALKDLGVTARLDGRCRVSTPACSTRSAGSTRRRRSTAPTTSSARRISPVLTST